MPMIKTSICLAVILTLLLSSPSAALRKDSTRKKLKSNPTFKLVGRPLKDTSSAVKFDPEKEIIEKECQRPGKAIGEVSTGSIEKAFELIERPISDSFLEPYRILLRARILFESGNYEESTSEILKLNRNFKNSVRKHPAGNNAAGLYSEILLKYPQIEPDSSIIFENSKSMGFKDLFRCLISYARRGDACSVFSLIQYASEKSGRYEEEIDTEPLKQLIKDSAHEYGIETIMETVNFAERLGWSNLSDILLAILEKSYPEFDGVDLARVDILTRRGKRKNALKLALRVKRQTQNPVIKRESMLRIASLNYDLGRVAESARIYSGFSETYPSYGGIRYITDRTARIFLYLGEWENACQMWQKLREGIAADDLTSNSAVTEAVLKLWLGRREEAHGILRDCVDSASLKYLPAFYYWLFRASVDAEEKNDWSTKLREEFPFSFYTWAINDPAFELIDERRYGPCLDLGKELEAPYKYTVPLKDTVEAYDTLYAHYAFNAFRFFLKEGINNESSEILDILLKDFGGDEISLYQLALLIRAEGMNRLLFKITNKKAAYHSNDFRLFKFPLHHPEWVCECSRKYKLFPELIFAVMREESKFDSQAESRSGAIGLMQITPSTGLWIAEMNGNRIEAEQLLDPHTNIQLGSWYLDYLLRRNSGSLIGAISAYNAGFGKMSEWRKRYEPNKTPMIALELIGIKETRNYVKKVLDSALMYRSFYSAEAEE